VEEDEDLKKIGGKTGWRTLVEDLRTRVFGLANE